MCAVSELLAEDAGVDELGAARVHGRGPAVVRDGADAGAGPLEGSQLAGHRQHARGRPVPQGARHVQLQDAGAASNEIVSTRFSGRYKPTNLLI